MMYVLVLNGAIKCFPYSVDQLRRDRPEISFPKNPSDSMLSLYGVFRVKKTERPDYNRLTHDLIEKEPELIDNTWTQRWVLKSVSDEVIEKRKAELAESIRLDRNERLQETDWIVVRSYEHGEQVKPEFASYRKALRDIPEQAGFPESVVWPEQPK